MLQTTSKRLWTQSRPFSWSAALNPSPTLTKSRSRNCGLRLAPLNGTHSLTLAMILENFSLTVPFKSGTTAHEATLLVVGASSGSLTITPSPMGMMLMLSEWLIIYEWSPTDNGPFMRSTSHGKLGSVTLKGVSQIWSPKSDLENSRTRVLCLPSRIPVGWIPLVMHQHHCQGKQQPSFHYQSFLPEWAIPSFSLGRVRERRPKAWYLTCSHMALRDWKSVRVDVPALSNAGFQISVTDRPSGLVKMKVRISFGLLSKKVLTVFR